MRRVFERVIAHFSGARFCARAELNEQGCEKAFKQKHGDINKCHAQTVRKMCYTSKQRRYDVSKERNFHENHHDDADSQSSALPETMVSERRRVPSRPIFCWFRRAGNPGRARDECGRSGVTGVWSESRAGATRGDGASGPCPNGARPVAEPAIFFPLGRHRVPLPSCSPSPLYPDRHARLTFRSPRTPPGVRPHAAPRRVVFFSRGPRASRRAARRESRRSRG